MIYIVWAPPRQGKTFYLTYLALKELRKTKDAKQVFSNFPIMYQEELSLLRKIRNRIINIINKIRKRPELNEKGKLLSSYRWYPEFIYTGIHDAMIIIDEAYRDYSSRNFKDFKVDQHTFFATNGHDNNDIYLIAQGINRIDVIIREMVNLFIFVKKTCLPWSKKPLYFTIETYLSEEDFKRRRQDEECTWTRERLRFKPDVARAYDTHYFKHSDDSTPYKKWSEELSNEQIKKIRAEIVSEV